MSITQPAQRETQAAALTEKIKGHVKDNWLHNYEIGTDKTIVSSESYAYRRRIYDALFASLFVDRSVLVLDEASGLYPALIRRGGARAVTASSANRRTCELIREVTEFLDAPTTVVRSKMVAFDDCEPYVDMGYENSHEFLFAVGQVWPMFGASGESLDAVVEACAFFVTHGLVYDWNDASWASPPPPEHYNLAEFCDALRRKFEFVASYGDWLVVATEKLPPAQAASAPLVSTPRRRTLSTPESRQAAYREFVPRLRETVCRAIPPDATALVVSKGDAQLLNLEGRTGWHFPQGANGEHLGYHPADSAAAIEQLESLRVRGAQFLVLPKPSFWWLEHYAPLREHLESRYSLIVDDDDTCMIFDLASRGAD